MICRCFGKTLDLTAALDGARKSARTILGVPDYDAYIEHMKAAHPDQVPQASDDFYRSRLQSRFARGSLRCC